MQKLLIEQNILHGNWLSVNLLECDAHNWAPKFKVYKLFNWKTYNKNEIELNFVTVWFVERPTGSFDNSSVYALFFNLNWTCLDSEKPQKDPIITHLRKTKVSFTTCLREIGSRVFGKWKPRITSKLAINNRIRPSTKFFNSNSQIAIRFRNDWSFTCKTTFFLTSSIFYAKNFHKKVKNYWCRKKSAFHVRSRHKRSDRNLRNYGNLIFHDMYYICSR